jgi:hypothetical protein
MQLSTIAMRALKGIVFLGAGVCFAGVAVDVDADWPGKSYAEFTLALEAYNEEREPKNLPEIDAAIVELKARIARNEDAPLAVALAVQFLKTQAAARFIEQRRGGTIPADAIELQYLARDPAVVEARAILRDALTRFPRSAEVLNAALRSDLLEMSNAKRIELLQTIVDSDPAAFIQRWELARLLAFERRTPEMRQQLTVLLERPDVDAEAIGFLLDGLVDLLGETRGDCQALAAELQPVLAAIPVEFPTSHQVGAFTYLKDDLAAGPERNARAQVLQSLRMRVAAALSASACGAEP